VLTLANLVVAGLMLGCLAAAAYCKRSLVREARGQEIHAHSDGTVHEHHRGGTAHTHPTFVERYDSRVARIFGPFGHSSL
jgi:hypothetical protein